MVFGEAGQIVAAVAPVVAPVGLPAASVAQQLSSAVAEPAVAYSAGWKACFGNPKQKASAGWIDLS